MVVKILSPVHLQIVSGNEVTVNGIVSDDGSGIAAFSVNGMPVEVNSDGSFSITLPLTETTSPIVASATDFYGNSSIDFVRLVTDFEDKIFVFDPDIVSIVYDPPILRVNDTGKIRVKIDEKLSKILTPMPFSAGEIAAGEV